MMVIKIWQNPSRIPYADKFYFIRSFYKFFVSLDPITIFISLKVLIQMHCYLRSYLIGFLFNELQILIHFSH